MYIKIKYKKVTMYMNRIQGGILQEIENCKHKFNPSRGTINPWLISLISNSKIKPFYKLLKILQFKGIYQIEKKRKILQFKGIYQIETKKK